MSTHAVIIVELDDYGKICDFNIELPSEIEVCDKNEPTKTKIGLELNQKTLTKQISCGSCKSLLSFNLIVRTARARRRNRNKRKAQSDIVEAELENIKKSKIVEQSLDKEIKSMLPDPPSQENHKEIPQIVQEEIIIENSADTSVVYQCPVEICRQLFESMEDWQKHYLSQHHEGKSQQDPIKVTLARTSDNEQLVDDHAITDEIELVLEPDDTYVFPKCCSSCKEPISLDPGGDQCYFCSYHKNQNSSNAENYDFFCTSCSSSFETQQKLTEHVKLYHPVYRCPVCFTSFETNKSLADHLRTTCKIKWINCDLCSHIAVSENTLKKHKERVHNVNF